MNHKGILSEKKKASLKSLHIVWVPLYDILEKKKKTNYGEEISGCQGVGGIWEEGRRTMKG